MIADNERNQTIEEKARCLFKVKHGTVTVEVWGPTGGYLWRKVFYYRWSRDTKNAGKWLKVDADRPVDQPYVQGCAKAVSGWLKAEG